jgi:hypothetical protein
MKKGKIKVLTPVKAMRAKCLDCCCNEIKEVRECPQKSCALWPYRMGRKPKGDEFVDSKGRPLKTSTLL